jgi:excisionase family DNA binding protein
MSAVVPDAGRPGPLLLRVEEAAAVLRIGRTRMFALIESGEVRSLKLGRSRRVPVDALRAYVDQLMTDG